MTIFCRNLTRHDLRAVIREEMGPAIQAVLITLARMETNLMTIHEDVNARVDALDAKIDAILAELNDLRDKLDPDKMFTADEVNVMLDKVAAHVEPPVTPPTT